MDDHLDPSMVQVLVLDDQKQEIYFSPHGRRSDSFQLQAVGRLKVCIRNGLHLDHMIAAKRKDKIERRVGLHIQVKTYDGANNVHAGIQKVNSEIWNFRSHHDHMRTREADHRALAESTFSGILFWAIMEALFVLLTGVGQVFLVRRFFEKQRRLY